MRYSSILLCTLYFVLRSHNQVQSTKYKARFVTIMTVLVVLICTQTAQSQLTEKFEVGGQVSVLQLSVPVRATGSPTGICAPPPCLAIVKERETQLGFGGRIGYNVTNNVALEAELNLFPDGDPFGDNEIFDSPANDLFEDGYQIQGLFGAKVGKRFEKVGIFAKARPGFLSARNGDLRPRPGVGCIAIFPPPAGCFEPVRKTYFAFDLGGVLEVYPSRRIVIRFDAGDTIVRFGDRTLPLVFTPLGNSFLAAFSLPAETTHNFQASIGVAFRF